MIREWPRLMKKPFRQYKMLTFGTLNGHRARKAMLLGSGELGKEVTIELQRLGVEVVACDKYAGAPAMHVADKARVFNMLDPVELRRAVLEERPDHIIPEIEAIATDELVALEREGWNVTPSARAARLTMNREGIRRLAAEELGLPTTAYRFASTREEYIEAINEIGLPCVVKPVMSSSGHGQSCVRVDSDVEPAWNEAQSGGRAGEGKVIVERFLDFDYEITLLTVRCVSGTLFCEPIGHVQEGGDYQYSWQPRAMSAVALEKSKQIALKITEALGGYGIFGVELFIKGDEVYFSEVSPRPHDTGMVTMISQDLSEFALHARALLGLPVPQIEFYGPSASRAIVVEGNTDTVLFDNLGHALATPGVNVRIFGKPRVEGHRRMGVVLATGTSTDEALAKALEARNTLEITTK